MCGEVHTRLVQHVAGFGLPCLTLIITGTMPQAGYRLPDDRVVRYRNRIWCNGFTSRVALAIFQYFRTSTLMPDRAVCHMTTLTGPDEAPVRTTHEGRPFPQKTICQGLMFCQPIDDLCNHTLCDATRPEGRGDG